MLLMKDLFVLLLLYLKLFDLFLLLLILNSYPLELLILILSLEHPIKIGFPLLYLNLEITFLQAVSNHHPTLERLHIIIIPKDLCVSLAYDLP